MSNVAIKVSPGRYFYRGYTIVSRLSYAQTSWTVYTGEIEPTIHTDFLKQLRTLTEAKTWIDRWVAS